MFEQTSGNDLRRRRAGRLAGALGLLLALALVTGGVVPALAQGMPTLPHGFGGTVSTLTPPQLVPEGTLVQAFLDGVKKAEAYVDADGRYQLLVSGPGSTVTFRVAGVVASQSSVWQSGVLDNNFNLTINALPTAAYVLTMAVAPGGTGNATDLTGGSPYGEGVEIDIRAAATTGYGFVQWTATPAVVFGDAKDRETSFSMPASDVTVTANFGEAYPLTMAANPAAGGAAIDVQNKGEYAAGGKVSIKAQPAVGYEFVNWTASPPLTFANPNAPETTFTMMGVATTITANFQAAGFTLTVAASPIVGGTVSVFPVKALYQAGDTVQIQAGPASGYTFQFWTVGVGGGSLGNPNVALTTFTMPASDVTVTALFQIVTSGGGVCFIATAAYGSSSAEQIDVLREFRDTVLLSSTVGSGFVSLYYRLSPPAAEVISGNSFLRTMVRELLVDPLVWLVEATGGMWRD